MVAIALLTLATPALAYWRSVGSGTASATTATLLAPTSVAATSTNPPNVSLTWSASAGSVTPSGYYVTRTNGSTVAACASSATSLLTTTSCVDVNVPPGGPYTYTVIAVYRSWDAASLPSSGVTVPAATMLAFTVQPSAVVAGVSISPAVQVTVETATGSPYNVAGTSVTVALTTPGAATLSGTTTATTNAGGVASFSNLSVDKAASYTLTASSSGLTSAVSSTFTVTAASATKFVITTSAFAATASATASTGPITVQEQDSFGNAVTAGGAGTLVNLSSNSAGVAVFAASLNGTGTASVTIPSGSSAVSFWYGDKKAGTPTITASGSLTSATQSETISAGAAAQLVFGQQPTNAARGAVITPSVTAIEQDAFGNQTTATDAITIAIQTNAGLLGLGVLYGTLTRTAVAGVATFNDLKIDGAILGIGAKGTGYTLKITGTGLTAAISSPFNIT